MCRVFDMVLVSSLTPFRKMPSRATLDAGEEAVPMNNSVLI